MRGAGKQASDQARCGCAGALTEDGTIQHVRDPVEITSVKLSNRAEGVQSSLIRAIIIIIIVIVGSAKVRSSRLMMTHRVNRPKDQTLQPTRRSTQHKAESQELYQASSVGVSEPL